MEEYMSSDDEGNAMYYDDFDDNGDLGLDNMDPTAGAGGPSIKIITKESLLAAQREDLQTVMDLLSLKEHTARTLLIHYRWDVDKLLTVLVEQGKDKLYAQAGVIVVEHENHVPLRFSRRKVMCEICMEGVSERKVTTMDCGHFFCNNCWTEHFIVKINEGQSRRVRCMAHQCNAVCDEEKVRTLVSARDPNLAVKFDRFLLESYIEDNRKVKWCPSVPHCGNAIRTDDDELCEVECACGLQFCFSCLYEPHSPCSCPIWKLWTQKCQDESETVNWIQVNTMPCPSCHKSVQKNGGCNHMTCICGQGFCWLCGGPLRGAHSCGRFKEDNEGKFARAKRDLLRYMHYHNRFKAHKDSLKLESKLKETIGKKISSLEEIESTSKDYSWVAKALYRLFRSRSIISYSYPFAYYMFGDNLLKSKMKKKEIRIKQNLFEDQQQQLEANIEKLSSLIEEPFDQFSLDKVMELRTKTINLSKVVDNLCRKLYECIENDFLSSLEGATHIIAPYKSDGVEKASELTCFWDTKSS